MPPLPPADLILSVLLHAVAAPALAAAAVLAACLAWRSPRFAAVAPVAAVAIAFVAGNWCCEVFPWLPEKPGWHWLPTVAGSTLLVALLARLTDLPRPASWLMYAAQAAVAAVILTPDDIRVETWWAAPLFAAVVWGGWVLLDHLARTEPSGVALAVVLAALAGGTVAEYAGWDSMAQAATILAASFAILAVAAWRFPLDVGAAAPAGLVFLAGLLFAAWHDTDSAVPTAGFVLAAVTPLTLAVLLLPPVRRLRGKARSAVFLLLLLLPTVTAVVLTMRAESLPQLE